MTPVDLNRLREAREDMEFDPDAEYFPVPFVELVDAVLDAPTEWRCTLINVPVAKCGHEDAGCGPVKVVPVKGANNAT